MKNHRARWNILVGKSLATVVLTIAACSYVDHASAQSLFAKLKVIMIRKVVQGQPAKRRSSPPISTYTVRFRLEVSPDHEIYVLSPGGKGAPPVGFTLERSDRGVIRVDKDKEDGELKSADIEGLARTTSPSWILLPPMSALEWEIETESSRAGVQEATTVYIRESMNRPAAELPSGWYTLAEETH